MGADLITFILKGPAKITPEQRAVAIEMATKIITYAKKLDSVLDKDDEDLTAEDQKLVEEGLNDPLLEGFQDQEQHSSARDAHSAINELAELDPTEEVDEFIEWWMTGGYHARDTNCRPDPDDETQQIIVCGDMSYGDTPDGRGYSLCRQAFWLGIFPSLGIR